MCLEAAKGLHLWIVGRRSVVSKTRNVSQAPGLSRPVLEDYQSASCRKPCLQAPNEGLLRGASPDSPFRRTRSTSERCGWLLSVPRSRPARTSVKGCRRQDYQADQHQPAAGFVPCANSRERLSQKLSGVLVGGMRRLCWAVITLGFIFSQVHVGTAPQRLRCWLVLPKLSCISIA